MGDINVYTGPMKCGKSQKILNEFYRQIYTGKKIQFFKPLVDNRFGKDHICSRDGNKIGNVININTIDEIKNYESDIYFIDEFQFLNGNIDTIQELAGQGKKFFIAGLNLTSEKKPFGQMGNLLCIADNIQMLTSICEICRCEDAVLSYYKGTKNRDIIIGDTEYIPVCRRCYQELMQKR